jgi:hypothetical protein
MIIVNITKQFIQLHSKKVHFSVKNLNLDGILLAQVFDHFGREEFGGGGDAVGFEESTVGLEPTAESVRTNTRGAG